MTCDPRLAEASDDELGLMVAEGQAAQEELVRRQSRFVAHKKEWPAVWISVAVAVVLAVALHLFFQNFTAPLLPERTYNEATSNSLAPVNPLSFPSPVNPLSFPSTGAPSSADQTLAD